MRSMYAILNEQYMPNIPNHAPVGYVEFAFSSEKKAQNQMDKLVELINQGKWWIEGEHTIVQDYTYPANDYFGFKRFIRVQHSNGTYSIYTLQKVELNHGYGI